jgi:DNA polymerase/3'-5' exonuclease PolX
MAHAFRKHAEEIMAEGGDKAGFKRNALMKAAMAVEHHLEPITSGKEAQKLEGVGKGSVALIDEFLESGVMGEKAKAEKEKRQQEEAGDGEQAAGAGEKAKEGKPKAGLAFLD